MTPAEFASAGPGLYVCVRLPDGRHVIAPAADQGNTGIIRVMRRINRAIMKNPGQRFPGKPEDYAAVAAWLEKA